MSKEEVVDGGSTSIKGDVNGDGQVGIGDISCVTNFMAGTPGEITLEQAYQNAEAPLRTFMYQQMKDDPSYITTFISMTRSTRPKNINEVPTYVLVPAYILHELTVAFKIGVLLYIPFIIIDMVVASILMSMGMMMLPPVQISMPFKLMLFVLVDGWGLLTTQLFHSVGL